MIKINLVVDLLDTNRLVSLDQELYKSLGRPKTKIDLNSNDKETCKPDQGIHNSNVPFKCENITSKNGKQCTNKICNYCLRLFDRKRVCIDCKEVLEIVAAGKSNTVEEAFD